MKKIFTVILFLFSQVSFSQINLVPNPSFEDTVQCPSSANQVGRCASWFNFGYTPDYFNSCANGGAGVPNNFAGYYTAHSGSAYCGAIFYSYPFQPDYLEKIGAQLSQSLQQGQKYYISFFVRKVGLQGYSNACNKLGIKFSSVAYSELNPPSLLDTADLYTDSIITDTLNWTQIKGSFISDSVYQYIIIGNFFHYYNVDTINSNQSTWAYYFIDDVCVSTDSTLCYSMTGIHNINTISDLIFPNPANNDLTIQIYQNNNAKLSIYENSGKIIFKSVIAEDRITINTSQFSEGIYCLQLLTHNTIVTRKLLIIH